MDLDAGAGMAINLTQRLRSILPWSGASATTDAVTRLIRTHRGIHSGADPALLRRAYGIAESKHRGQTRKSGEPYITHPLAVAQLVAEVGMDTTTLVAALLHDTVEDTDYTLEELERDFGPEVAYLVDGVTKFDKMFYGQDAEAETIRKMIVAAGRDVRVLIIKLADRVHNMRTLDARSVASRQRVARATQDVLVPLCDRLGIQFLKRDLEDAVLLHLEPEEYARIDDYVRHRPRWTEYLAEVAAQARVVLRRDKVDATVEARPRHYYTIWKDTVANGHPVPFDPPRIAVVVDGSETDCYTALGAIHGLWRPVSGRFKDFIASPKHNLYRSLHTTVIGPDQQPVEVLIRTEAMHRAAEYGIATSYRFPKATPAQAAADRADELAWLRRVLDWQQEIPKANEFLASLRGDLAEAQIQVFADGRPMLLPAKATPVDVAYELGTDKGDHCIAAKVNGRYSPLSTELDEGDVVEVFVEEAACARTGSRPRGPLREWLQFVKSPHAQMQINRWFADHNEPTITIANKVRLGRAAIGLALRRYSRGLASDLPLRQLAAELGYPNLESMLVSVADRKVDVDVLVDQLVALVDQRPPG